MEYVAFEVNRANIGRVRTEREKDTSGGLCVGWNRVFVDHERPLRICPAHGHTGNYWVYSEEPLAVTNLATILLDMLHHEFAVFAVDDYLGWLADLKAAMRVAPQTQAERRPTPGAVMNLNPAEGRPPLPASTDRIVFDDFATARVRGAWKLDRLRTNGVALDSRPGQREGGWGKVATEMKKLCGGRWTARAMSTLDGVAHALRVRTM